MESRIYCSAISSRRCLDVLRRLAIVINDGLDVRTVTDEEVYPVDAILEQNGDPITGELAVLHAKQVVATDSYETPACPIVFFPYRPAPKGGVR